MGFNYEYFNQNGTYPYSRLFKFRLHREQLEHPPDLYADLGVIGQSVVGTRYRSLIERFFDLWLRHRGSLCWCLHYLLRLRPRLLRLRPHLLLLSRLLGLSKRLLNRLDDLCQLRLWLRLLNICIRFLHLWFRLLSIWLTQQFDLEFNVRVLLLQLPDFLVEGHLLVYLLLDAVCCDTDEHEIPLYAEILSNLIFEVVESCGLEVDCFLIVGDLAVD